MGSFFDRLKSEITSPYVKADFLAVANAELSPEGASTQVPGSPAEALGTLFHLVSSS
jgi:exosome complex RNA-binding protein Rrp42 (RNase PH superfamily)